ncbi:MAG: DNA polymerase III subunit delta [Actinomycetota bacterium]|nr:DNA polymerase III subunit delta [Actinomycetota bacterium]
MTSVYLLSGEPYLAEEALEKIRREHSTDPLSEMALDAAAPGAALMEAVGTASLLGGRRLVVIRDAQDLKKEQTDALATYLQSPSPDTVLVLVASGKTKLDAAVKSAGVVVPLDAPKGRRLVTWLRQRAVERQIKLDDRGGWALVDAIGPELRSLDSALEQLVAAHGPGATIGATEVRRAFPRLAEERSFAFTDAVGERRLAAAMTSVRRLLDQGDEPLALFGVLSGHLRRLLRARQYAGEGAAAVGQALGMPEWRAERMTKQALSYREEELVRAMAVMAEADIEMKGEFPSAEAALERAVIRIITASS